MILQSPLLERTSNTPNFTSTSRCEILIEETMRKKTKHVNYAAKIFKKHDGFIRNIIFSRIKDKSRIEEIYQDCFVSLVTKPIPDGLTNEKAYIYQIVNHDIIDICRKIRSNNTQLRKYAKYYKQTKGSYRPDEILIKKEEIRNVFAVAETILYDREIRAVNLKFKKGYTSAEAARQMGIKRQSVNRYVTSSFRKLRGFFGATSHGQEKGIYQ